MIYYDNTDKLIITINANDDKVKNKIQYIKMQLNRLERFFCLIGDDVWELYRCTAEGSRPLMYGRDGQKVHCLGFDPEVLAAMRIIGLYDADFNEIPLDRIDNMEWDDQVGRTGAFEVAEHIPTDIGMTLRILDVPEEAYEYRFWSVCVNPDHTLSYIGSSDSMFLCPFSSNHYNSSFVIDRYVFDNKVTNVIRTYGTKTPILHRV